MAAAPAGDVVVVAVAVVHVSVAGLAVFGSGVVTAGNEQVDAAAAVMPAALEL